MILFSQQNWSGNENSLGEVGELAWKNELIPESRADVEMGNEEDEGPLEASKGKATNPSNDECRDRIRTIIERTLTGEARVDAEMKKARVERGAGDVLEEPKSKK